MSYKALAWAAEQRAGSTTGMAVLIALASFSDERGRCWPSQSTIAEKTYLSRETVNRTIRVLEGLQLVKRDGKCFVLNLEGVKILNLREKIRKEIQPRYRRCLDISLSKWRDLREFVFVRDEYICSYCDEFIPRDPQCDHIIPLVMGGKSTPDNLNTACKKCNSSKGGRHLDDWVMP